MTPDSELLRQYAEQGDQAAFAEVVHRHVDLVYSAALRVANGDVHLAEDVTQAVFVKLARHAASLTGLPTIIGWLHTTARHTAIKAIRSEQRRRVREQEASLMQQISTTPEVNWEQLRPFLDEAVDTLEESDRHAVLLRYFQNLSHQQVGAVLGLNEDTARKRVDRAVDKLRTHFFRRGIVVPSALLAEAMGANSVQAAPAGLAARATGAVSAGASISVAGGALQKLIFMSTKNKIALIVVILLIVGGSFWFSLRQPVEPPVPAASPLAATTPLPLKPSHPVTIEAPVIAPVNPALAKAPAVSNKAESVLPSDPAQIKAAGLFVTDGIGTPLISYKLATGHYPTTKQGMEALIYEPAGETGWRGPYVMDEIKAVPLDPWGNEYQYTYPGMHNPNAYDVWSVGPDGISGTEDDISNWK